MYVSRVCIYHHTGRVYMYTYCMDVACVLYGVCLSFFLFSILVASFENLAYNFLCDYLELINFFFFSYYLYYIFL